MQEIRHEEIAGLVEGAVCTNYIGHCEQCQHRFPLATALLYDPEFSGMLAAVVAPVSACHLATPAVSCDL